jgi:hypothetical protein
MAGILERAKERAQQGISQGKEKLEEVQAQREGHSLLKKLGAAYYAEKHGTGSTQRTRDAETAVEGHVAAHGDKSLRS